MCLGGSNASRLPCDAQVDKVCEQLKGIEELSGGYNAIGFSQGGSFLRVREPPPQAYTNPSITNKVAYLKSHVRGHDSSIAHS